MKCPFNIKKGDRGDCLEEVCALWNEGACSFVVMGESLATISHQLCHVLPSIHARLKEIDSTLGVISTGCNR